MKSSHFNHPTRRLPLVGLALLLVVSSGLAGCVSTMTPAAGTGVITYTFRELETTVPEDYNKVVEAARQAIKDLEFVKGSDRKDAYAARLEARTALDKKVVITVGNSGKNLTNIKIRVGLAGDQSLSISILNKIKAGL
jgi:hypothetical protein